MAITRIGSLVESTVAGRATNTGSDTAVSVPADAEIMVICFHGYESLYGAGFFSSGTVTIGGQACTAATTAGDANTSYFMGAMFYRLSPSTGTQTLAWDWLGVSGPTNAARIVYGFYKGLDLAGTPVRDADGIQTSPVGAQATPTLTASAGDLLVAWSWAWYGTNDNGGSSSWTNATEVTTYPIRYDQCVASWAEGSPSGNTTVKWTPWAGIEDGGVIGLVLSPTSGGVSLAPAQAAAALTGKGVNLRFAILMPDQP